MKMLKILTIMTLSTFFILISCTGTEKKSKGYISADGIFIKTLIEKQIGKSNYFISIPSNYSLKVTKGPDFDVFYFYPIDTTVKLAFFGGLYFGNHPSKLPSDNDSCETGKLRGFIMGKNSEWIVSNCNGIYTLQTIINNTSKEPGNDFIHAFGRATSRTDLSKLQDIFSTLKRKE